MSLIQLLDDFVGYLSHEKVNYLTTFARKGIGAEWWIGIEFVMFLEWRGVEYQRESKLGDNYFADFVIDRDAIELKVRLLRNGGPYPPMTKRERNAFLRFSKIDGGTKSGC